MSLRGAWRGSARVVIGIALVMVALPFASGDAEARRGGGKVIGVSAVPSVSRSRASEPNASAVPVEDATAAAPDTTGGETPARAHAVTPAAAVVRKRVDAEVPGCAVGKICTVCVAGCYGDNNSIIFAAPKGE
jgi:hypothetical protein